MSEYLQAQARRYQSPSTYSIHQARQQYLIIFKLYELTVIDIAVVLTRLCRFMDLDDLASFARDLERRSDGVSMPRQDGLFR
jgi:hypothetical protein